MGSIPETTWCLARKDWHGLHESTYNYFKVYAGTGFVRDIALNQIFSGENKYNLKEYTSTKKRNKMDKQVIL